jgi:hypothetical protein
MKTHFSRKGFLKAFKKLKNEIITLILVFILAATARFINYFSADLYDKTKSIFIIAICILATSTMWFFSKKFRGNHDPEMAIGIFMFTLIFICFKVVLP